MNRITTIKRFCGLLLMSAAVSCQEPFDPQTEPPTPIGDPTAVVITATTLDRSTRLSVEEDIIHSRWGAGDKMGVFLNFKDQWVGMESYSLVDGTIGEDGTSADFSGTGMGFKWQAAALPHSFYFYAPKVEEGDADPTAIPVSIPAIQSQDGVGSQGVSKHNLMIGEPVQITSPRNFEDPDLAKKVAVKMRGAFAIVELRFASFEDPELNPDVRVRKITLSSKQLPLTLAKGTIDITKADYATDFGIVSATEADYGKQVSLSLANPLEVPVTLRKNVVQGNRAREEADLDVVFPARMVVLPNMSEGNAWQNDELTVAVDFTVDGEQRQFSRTIVARLFKPGERHAIAFVLPVKEGSGGELPPEEPGTPWNGTFTAADAPAIDEANKTIEITTPAQLAWFANRVNTQTPVVGNGTLSEPETLLYDGYTMRIMNNINLGGHQWKPIGMDGVRYFRGNVEGDGDGDGVANLVSGLNITPASLFDLTGTATATEAHFGLFGAIKEKTNTPIRLELRNIRVRGDIRISAGISNAVSGVTRLGGVAATLQYANITNCSFSGSSEASFDSTNEFGGVTAYTLNSNIVECRCDATLKVTSASTELTPVGGLVADANSGTIRGCEFSGSLTITGAATSGGIAGRANVAVKACRNTGSIYAQGNANAVGGIVGRLIDNTVLSCYNTGTLTTTDGRSNSNFGGIGGIVGSIGTSNTRVQACYNRGTINSSSQQLQYAGNIVGCYDILTGYNYSRIAENYFVRNPLHTDEIAELNMNSVMMFSPTRWPQTTTNGWGTGDGSADNRYWNEIFPASYGTEEWEYPQLYWEVIE